MLENRGNGYNEYSMSNNAVNAYENGEKPYSKWTKADIIDGMKEIYKLSDEDVKRLKKYKVKTLKYCLLVKTSWHHTSSHYNRTDFYALDTDMDGMCWDYLDEANGEKEEEPDIQKARIKYVEWTGSRRHPKATDKEAYVIIKGNWAYLANGQKKKVSGNYVEVVKTFNRAPKGTAAEFKKIEKFVK